MKSFLLCLAFVLPIGAQTYQPDWNSIDSRATHWPEGGFVVKDVTGVKEVRLLGSKTPLKFKAAAGGVRVDVPALPEDLLHQPCWVLKISR